MGRLILICGSTGAGKTSYALKLARDIDGIRFSIDPWMQTLFAKDMKELDYDWMIERVYRCYEQVWEVSAQILGVQGSVVLDMGFTTKSQRDWFADRARQSGFVPEVHYLDVPRSIRKQRVEQRNIEKNPDVYTFEVTQMMFNFMEPRFEIPDAKELAGGLTLSAEQ